MENHAKVRRALGSLSVYAALLMYALGCGGGGDGGIIMPPPPPPPPPPAGTVVGTVRHVTQNTAIAGAVVSIGSVLATTGVDGAFTLNNVPAGTATIRCTSPGLADYTSNITVAAGTTTHDIRLSAQEVFEFFGGAFSLYVPASVTAVRGIVLALGGPDTRPFADPRRSFNLGTNPPPELESELMVVGTNYRLLAAREGLAVLGYGNVSVAGGLAAAVWVALEEAAAVASRPELANAPLLIDAISSGTPAAAQLTAQNPSRVAGLALRVPLSVADQLSPESGSVPTYVIIAELDEIVDNNVTVATYQKVRAAGGLWALAEEPGKQHRSHSASRNAVILEWFTTILPLRESATPGGPVRAIAEESGWLGAPVTRVVSSWADYVGDKRAASWFPTRATAERWRGFTGTQ